MCSKGDIINFTYLFTVKIKHTDCLESITGGMIQEYDFKINKTDKNFDVELTKGTLPIPSGTGVLVEFDASSGEKSTFYINYICF